jgi:probable phosphoglycerate mutase
MPDAGAPPEVWVARHGVTAWNAEGRIQGHTDVTLSEAGRRQAEALAERLRARPPARIVSSDLRRALETAEVVGARLGLLVETDRDFREQDLGRWQGLTGEEARARDPDLYAARFLARDPSARPPGGETRAELADRAWRAFHRHAAAGTPGPVLLVTHGGVLAALLYRVLAIPLSAPRGFHLPNAALTTFVSDGARWRVGTMNDASHVPREAGAAPFPFE